MIRGVSVRCALLSVILLAAGPAGHGASQGPGGAKIKAGGKSTMIAWGPERDGLRCAVLTPSGLSEFRAAEPVRVVFITKNFGDKPASVAAEGPMLHVYRVSVVGPDNQPAATTSYANALEPFAGSFTTAALAPGAEQRTSLLLSRIYDMTREGDYRVSFVRLVYPETGDPRPVSSNLLTIKVVGPSEEKAPN